MELPGGVDPRFNPAPHFDLGSLKFKNDRARLRVIKSSVEHAH